MRKGTHFNDIFGNEHPPGSKKTKKSSQNRLNDVHYRVLWVLICKKASLTAFFVIQHANGLKGSAVKVSTFLAISLETLSLNAGCMKRNFHYEISSLLDWPALEFNCVYTNTPPDTLR